MVCAIRVKYVNRVWHKTDKAMININLKFMFLNKLNILNLITEFPRLVWILKMVEKSLSRQIFIELSPKKNTKK
jgi:hypothetical protein